MIDYSDLRNRLKNYSVTDDKLLPWAYQTANPQGRPLHDDWLLFKNTPRIKTAFRVPIPFKMIAGNAAPSWQPIHDSTYPIVPGTEIKIMPWYDGQKNIDLPWIETMMAIHPVGQWSRQSAFLNGEWIECFYSRSVNLFGSRFTYYQGLKLDLDGPMCWFPELSASVKWGKSQ